jgi:hypothetical protein
VERRNEVLPRNFVFLKLVPVRFLPSRGKNPEYDPSVLPEKLQLVRSALLKLQVLSAAVAVLAFSNEPKRLKTSTTPTQTFFMFPHNF